MHNFCVFYVYTVVYFFYGDEWRFGEEALTHPADRDLNNLSHLDPDVFGVVIFSRSPYFFSRLEMLRKSYTVQIPPGIMHVRNNHVVQIPPEKTPLNL